MVSVQGAGNNERIAKNAILLYFRTLVVLLVNLYLSRLALKLLGVEDLGIYNVVGGTVALISFFNRAQASSTSRFITFELGNSGSDGSVGRVFGVALSIHIFLAIVLLLIGETIGSYVLDSWIKIPLERQDAAFWVFQLSLVLLFFQVLRVPFDSVIIAYENMSLYAYMSIAEVLMKFCVVYLLTFYDGNCLVPYAVLLTLTSVFNFFLTSVCVYYFYKSCRCGLRWDNKLVMQLLSFTGWSTLGNSANVATQQGVCLLFNNFVGLVANAAMGFTQQVNAAVGMFVGSFTTAFNPQIVKLYAQGDYKKLHLLMCRASKFSFVLAYLLSLPLIINMDFLLRIWLDEVPPFTMEFCQLVLVCIVIDATTSVYNVAISSTGNIRNYQIGIALSFSLDLFFAYLLLRAHLHPALVFSSRILTRGVLNMFIGLFHIKRKISFDLLNYVRIVLLPLSKTLVISFLIVFFVSFLSDGWSKLLLTSFASFIAVGVCVVIFILDKNEYFVIKQRLTQKCMKICG